MANTQQHFRTCHLCEAMCGIIIEHEGDQILSIKGDPDDPLSRGNICPKAVALQDLQSDPDRLRQPMKRVGTEWMPVSWDHAYEEIEHRFKAIRNEHGRHSLAVYAGNPTAHSAGAILFLPNLIRAFAGLSGPYDFLPLDGPITRRTFADSPDLPATQPGAYARPDAPAAFLATGDADTTVYPRNTRKLAAALGAAGARVEERHYAGLDHSDTVLALSRPLRGKAPVLTDMVTFLRASLT